MAKIAKEYLEKLKVTNTQFAITKHTDRRHIHLHIVANMVDNNGKAISDSFLGLRGKKTSQQLTQQYQLVPALSKNLELTNYGALHQSEANKYKVYKAIVETLPHCKTWEELKNKLQLQGIGTQYKYRGQTMEKQGVSFKIGDDCFKGSQVDRQFSLGNIEKALVLNQKQSPEFKQKSLKNTNQHSLQTEKQKVAISDNNQGNFPDDGNGGGLEKVMEILLKPEENKEQTPIELLKENKQKKKKQSLNQHRGLHH